MVISREIKKWDAEERDKVKNKKAERTPNFLCYFIMTGWTYRTTKTEHGAYLAMYAA